MTLFKRILDFYIQSSIHVGLALFSLTYVTAFSNDLSREIPYPACIFFGTILGYNFLKYYDIFRKGKFYFLKYYGILLVCFFSAIGFYFFFEKIQDYIKSQLFIAGILVLVYPLLRRYGILKMFWVSFVIAYLTAFVSITTLSTFSGIWVLQFIKRFVLISALMIPFEIYDSQHDDKTLNTLPQKYGEGTAKNVGYFLLLLFVILEVLDINSNNEYLNFGINILIAILIALVIYFTSTKKSQYYCSFWAEGIPILWLLLMILFQ